MNERHLQPAKQIGTALAVLTALGIASRWAPKLSSLLVILVLLYSARYAWETLAKLAPSEVAQLLAVASFALTIGFLAKFGVNALILTGLVLLVMLPLRRPTRSAESHERDGQPEDTP
jgi:MFS-type transporter involved in bile tolerance (Atg22 family)